MKRCTTKSAKGARRSRSVEEDPMKLCTTKSTEEAGWIGPGEELLLRRCTTMSVEAAATAKRKAAEEAMAGQLCGPVMDSTKRKAAAGGVPEGEKHAADVATATAEDTGVEEWTPGGLTKLPDEYVNWILSRKRQVLEEDPDEYYNRMTNDPDRPEVYTQEFLEEERQLMRDMAGLYKRAGDRMEKFQNWVRLQLKTKGRVEVDDTYLAQRVRYRQEYKEEWAAMMRDLRLPGFIDEDEDAKNPGAGVVALESRGDADRSRPN